jgi:hypothetical protein
LEILELAAEPIAQVANIQIIPEQVSTLLEVAVALARQEASVAI